MIAEREALGKLIRKYEDLPMSLADASLVRLAELQPGASVFTLDAHFFSDLPQKRSTADSRDHPMICVRRASELRNQVCAATRFLRVATTATKLRPSKRAVGP